jgi:signal transduction histidine kinase
VDLVVGRAVLATRSDRGVMSWIDGNEMIVAGCHDPFGELVPVGGRWPLAGEQVSKVALAAGLPAAGSFDEIEVDGVSAALRDTYTGLKYLLVMPVSVAGEDVAILCVSRRRSEEYTAEDSEILDAIARVGAHPLRAARLGQMLGATLEDVSGRLADAESVERVKTDILRLASHELRTPLTVLHGYLSMIRDGFFGEVPDSLAPRVSAQHRLRVDLPPDPLPARIDTERVGLALRNILDNAVKYSPDGGEVVCSAFADGDRAIVRVADHGLGIAPEDRDKLFTRFGRVLTTANSHIPGIGLGLYFAREVARRHGGDVRLVEADGPGSTFDITLPLAR